MIAERCRSFRFATMVAAAAVLGVISTASYAYTPEQEQACTGDAFRLCSSDIPDVDRVTVCMIRNKAQLSPGCRVHFRAPARGPVLTPVSARRPVNLAPRKTQKRRAL